MDNSLDALHAAQLFSVKDLVAVISGGGSGIGRVIAQALAANGAKHVYILGRRMDVLQETAASFPNMTPIICDVTCKDMLQAAADKVWADAGYINMLWCNSGTSGPECAEINATTSLDDFVKHNWAPSVDDYASTFKVNTAGSWYTAIAFLRLLNEGNKQTAYRSQIVATCSTLGFGRFAATGRFAYGQSKASQMHLMKQLGTHLVPYGIRVNMVAPGCKCTFFLSLFPLITIEGLTDLLLQYSQQT